MAEAFGPFISGATLFKHQGFKEEREVRIVAIPAPSDLRERQLSEDENLLVPPAKEIRTRIRGEYQRRYLALFGFEDTALPIKRVIVGPSSHQKENYERAARVVGSNVAISRSETPFVGN